MDINAIGLGEDFVRAIEATLEKCVVLIAVIGTNWLTSKDDQGARRLDNPLDFVRMEVRSALKRHICVIPVLMDGALMPREFELPGDLKPLVRLNALPITDTSFEDGCQRLVAAIKKVLQNVAVSTPATTPTPTSTSTPMSTAKVGPDAEYYNYVAWGHYESKQYDLAIHTFTKAIQLLPNYAYAFVGRGNAYLAKKDHDKAIDDYNDAIMWSPNSAFGYQARALAYLKLGIFAKAQADFAQRRRSGTRDAIVKGSQSEKQTHKKCDV